MLSNQTQIKFNWFPLNSIFTRWLIQKWGIPDLVLNNQPILVVGSKSNLVHQGRAVQYKYSCLDMEAIIAEFKSRGKSVLGSTVYFAQSAGWSLLVLGRPTRHCPSWLQCVNNCFHLITDLWKKKVLNPNINNRKSWIMSWLSVHLGIQKMNGWPYQ